MKMTEHTVRNIEEAFDERLRELDREGLSYEVVVQENPLAIFSHKTGWVEIENKGVHYFLPTVTDDYVMGVKVI